MVPMRGAELVKPDLPHHIHTSLPGTGHGWVRCSKGLDDRGITMRTAHDSHGETGQFAGRARTRAKAKTRRAKPDAGS